MPLLLFLSEAVLISLSGVMAPGPVSAVVIAKGSKSPWAGSLVALGHGLVEFPLMVAVFLGVGQFLDSSGVAVFMGVAGGLFVVWMGIGMLRSLKQDHPQQANNHRSPFLSGIVLSIANPYFLVWWGTVGAALIFRSFEFGPVGFVVFALSHWLCDLVWDTFLGVMSYKGGQFFGNRFQQVVFALSGILLLFYGGRLVWSGIKPLLLL